MTSNVWAALLILLANSGLCIVAWLLTDEMSELREEWKRYNDQRYREWLEAHHGMEP